MKKLAILIAIVLMISTVSGCSKYQKANIIGLTKVQVQERYGDFDLNGAPFMAKDGSYQGFGYGYLLQESHVGYLGTNPAVYFFIVFDKNDIAIDCYKGYHSNGG